MTLDDETAERIANETWAKRGKRHTVSGEEYVRAGYAYRDAEVEELRAELDILRATEDGNLSAMRERDAEKWDEGFWAGYAHGYGDGTQPDIRSNPYRTERP